MALRFVSSFPRVAQMPDTVAEVALVGRSNVGKSSLLNALAQRTGLARTSKTPGATRLLNAFELGAEGSRRWLVDLPGYGYAKASKAEKGRWNSMAEAYLADRDPLRGVLHLIDGEIGPTGLDIQTADWLASVGLPVTYVATKADKVRPSRRGARRADLASKLGTEPGQVHWTSAAKGTGIPELRALVAALLNA